MNQTILLINATSNIALLEQIAQTKQEIQGMFAEYFAMLSFNRSLNIVIIMNKVFLSFIDHRSERIFFDDKLA